MIERDDVFSHNGTSPIVIPNLTDSFKPNYLPKAPSLEIHP